MTFKWISASFNGFFKQCLVAVLCGLLTFPVVAVRAAEPSAPPPAVQDDAPKIPPDQLDSLVAPVALFPDQLLAQILAASTYPLEIVQLRQWMEKNPGLKDTALTDAVKKQDWDPSVQALVVFPDLVKNLEENIKWTTDLGNAFLAQQSDVMDAVQRMRIEAKDSGKLASNQQQKVETKVVESKTVVIVEPANPEVVYVPSYNPTVIWGAPVYPYPVYTYPPYSTGAVIAASAISFGVGLAVGAAWGGGGWGWGCGWGHNDININVNNNFNRNTNIRGGNRVNNIQGGNRWQHNPSHRGGTPYSNRQTANRFGGTTRGASAADRRANARQQVGNRDFGSNTPRDLGNRSGANTRDLANRGGANTRDLGNRGGANTRDLANRGGSNTRDLSNRGGANTRDLSNRGGSNTRDLSNRGGANTRDLSNRGGSGSRDLGNRSGGGDRVGNRQISQPSSNRGAFSGISSGSGARQNSMRGNSSLSSGRSSGSFGGRSGGGGGGFGGGGRGGGGGGRGGGGRRR